MPNSAYVVFTLIAVACLRRSIRNLVMSPWDGAVWLLDTARQTLAGWSVRLRAAAHQRLVEIDLHDGRAKASYGVFAVLMTGSFLACAATEALLIALSMQALLGMDGIHIVGPRGTESLLVGSLLLAGIVSISVWLTLRDEDGESHVVPLHWLGPRARKALLAIAGTSAVLVIAAVVGLALLRAHEVIRADAEIVTLAVSNAEGTPAPDVTNAGASHLTDGLRYIVLGGSGLAMLGATALTYEVGVAVLLRLQAWLLTCVLILLVDALRVVLGLMWTLARAVRTLVRYAIDGALAVATLVARIPVSAVQALHAWGSQRATTPPFLRLVKGAVAVLTSIAVDIEMPDLRSHT